MPTLFSASIRSQTAPPLETGVSNTLAKWRAANYSDVRYKLNITLEKGVPLMKGDIEIRVKLTDEGAKNDLILDWHTTQFANDRDKPYARVAAVNNAVDFLTSESKEHIIIPHEILKAGENVIKINFASPIKTSGSAITRYVDKEDKAEYIYSLFVPSDASTAFPVFDQPDLKARFSLLVDKPKGWKVISNSAGKDYIEKVSDYTGECKSCGTFDYTEFEETKPISTYVFAFAAGEFAEFTEYDENTVIDEMLKNQLAKKEKEAQKMRNQPELAEPSPLSRIGINSKMGNRVYVRKSQAEKFKQHSAEVFRLNREGVKFLESYFDYKFPFPKYDLVLIPEFPFGGMEHAGATFLRETSVIFPTEPTKNDLVSRANVIFHEAAHQWFGDTVTMKWFDDLWLKEGFAEFMAYKTLEKVMPEYNVWKIFYERNKQAAYLTDSTRGTTPIYQEIPNLSAAKSAYGNIVYRKAPSFLKQAEFYLGEKEFQTAVRAFLKKHEFANAEWTDLVKEFEIATKKDLKDWANGWVKERGAPKVKARIEKFTNAPERIRIEQYSAPFTGWQFKTQILWRDINNKSQVSTIEFKEAGSIWLWEKSDSPFSFVFPNYQDYGYGIFLLDEKSRAYILKNIQNEKDDFLRAMMWGALWDSVREGELDPQDYVELVIKNIQVETDESTIQTLLGRVSTAMNYYLSDAQRDELAPKVEAIVFGGMTSAKTSGLRTTFFRAYLNVASTENARIWLRKILESNGKPIEQPLPPGLMITRNLPPPPPLEMPTLRAKDKFDIITKLLILKGRRTIDGNEDEQRLAELEKSENSDEARRYAYAARAGIGKADSKAKYWNDFTNNKDLSESYIEAAFAVFNAPQHLDLTLPYLEKALAELPNLKKTRKIFFVNGWLAAFIGGQRSEEALKIVNKFLADNPNLDKDLRLKILENADGLERAVRIRAAFKK